MSIPFIVYALPRSRTAWLSKFLSYGDWTCHHEQAIYMRTMDDVRALLSRPDTGCVETAAAQGRYLIKHAFPDIREVVILRPVKEVVNSMLNTDVASIAAYDPDKLQKIMEYGDRILRKIAQDVNVLAINYSDLVFEEACADIFEHCLPYRFDKSWWKSLKFQNIQVDVKAVLQYYFDNREAVDGFKRHCKSELRRLHRAGEISAEMRM